MDHCDSNGSVYATDTTCTPSKKHNRHGLAQQIAENMWSCLNSRRPSQNEGHWVCDETTGDEGFLDEHEDLFWVYDEEQCFWMKCPFQGRYLRKDGKSKGGKGKQGKSKGKGASARRFFRPYRKGGGKGKKSGKSSGSAAKANVAEEEVEEEEIEDDALLADKKKRKRKPQTKKKGQASASRFSRTWSRRCCWWWWFCLQHCFLPLWEHLLRPRVVP